MEIYNTYEDLRKRIFNRAVKGLSSIVIHSAQVNEFITDAMYKNEFDYQPYDVYDYDYEDDGEFGHDGYALIDWSEPMNEDNDYSRAYFLYKKNVINLPKLKDIINQAKILGKHYVKLDAFLDCDADDYIWSLEDRSYCYCDEVHKIWWDRKESKNLL